MHEAEKQNNHTTRAKMSIIENLVKDMTASEILSKLEEESKNITRVQRIHCFSTQLQGVNSNYLVITSRSLQRSMSC